jgi:UDP-N-acetylmuramate: L-alanyl-gamma-D-glutamyl-meso-diaminopimelate ligase
VLVFSPESLKWNAAEVFAPLGERAQVYAETDVMIQSLVEETHPGDQVLIMSNGGFENIHQRLLDAMQARI